MFAWMRIFRFNNGLKRSAKWESRFTFTFLFNSPMSNGRSYFQPPTAPSHHPHPIIYSQLPTWLDKTEGAFAYRPYTSCVYIYSFTDDFWWLPCLNVCCHTLAFPLIAKHTCPPRTRAHYILLKEKSLRGTSHKKEGRRERYFHPFVVCTYVCVCVGINCSLTNSWNARCLSVYSSKQPDRTLNSSILYRRHEHEWLANWWELPLVHLFCWLY